MRAYEVEEFLRSLDDGWVNWSDTTDRFVAGDPATPVAGIAVGWMAYRESLERAANLRCNLFVTHEPTVFDHRDLASSMDRFPGVRQKRAWIEEHGMCIYRCHDLWDQMPHRGIPDAWGHALGFGQPEHSDGYFRLYRIAPSSAVELARDIATRLERYGQGQVELVGPPDRRVRTVALGTGAISPLPTLVDRYSPDLAICSDDGFTYWHAGALAIDLGVPAIVVNHAVSELPGIEELARVLGERFPNVAVHHLSQRCMYTLVGPN